MQVRGVRRRRGSPRVCHAPWRAPRAPAARHVAVANQLGCGFCKLFRFFFFSVPRQRGLHLGQYKRSGRTNRRKEDFGTAEQGKGAYSSAMALLTHLDVKQTK